MSGDSEGPLVSTSASNGVRRRVKFDKAESVDCHADHKHLVNHGTTPRPGRSLLPSVRWLLALCLSVTALIGYLLVFRVGTGEQDPLDVSPDVLLTIYSYDRPRHLLHLLQDVSDRMRTTSLRVAVHVVDDNSLGCTPVDAPTSNYYDAFDNGEAGGSPHSENSACYSFRLPISEISEGTVLGRKLVCPPSSRFRFVSQFVAARAEINWRMYISHYRHGRRRYWHLIHMAHRLAACHARNAKYFIFLPDDVRLSSDFFSRATRAWNSIAHAQKMTLMLHIEESREHSAVWTDFQPTRESDDLIRIGWVESGNFVAGPAFMHYFNWSFPRVPIQRWINNPPISSGVGALLSETLHRNGFYLFRTEKSLVAHVGVTYSKMNAQFRDKSQPAHRTLYFVDGEATYEGFLHEASIVVASMASTWNREVALHAVLESLAPQVDHINVYLNGFDTVPAFLQVPYITAKLSGESDSGDIGDVGKFFWADKLQADFHLTADDDILYPSNYVDKLLDFIKLHKSPLVVGVHGINILHDLLTPPAGRGRGRGYYGSREVFMATESVPEPQNVHILGTGTMMYRVSDVGPLSIHGTFPRPNMADIWFGVLAQKRKLPLVTIPHDPGWLREIPGTFQDSIYTRATRRRHKDRHQTAAVIAAAPWQFHQPRPAEEL